MSSHSAPKPTAAQQRRASKAAHRARYHRQYGRRKARLTTPGRIRAQHPFSIGKPFSIGNLRAAVWGKTL